MDTDDSLKIPLDLLRSHSLIMASNGIAIKAMLVDYREKKDEAYLAQADDAVIKRVDRIIDHATNINIWATTAETLAREEYSPDEYKAALNALANARLSLVYMQYAYEAHVRDEDDWVGKDYMQKFFDGTVKHIAAMTKMFDASENAHLKPLIIGPARTGKTTFRALNYSVDL